jgi:ferredoxin--NADP+ reductase
MPQDESKFYRATVVECKEFAPDLWAARLASGGPFTFTPGQYATLGVEGPARLVERAYSIVSSPYEEQLEFFFELVPHGELTPLIHTLKPGDQLSMRKSPKGRFVLDLGRGPRNHLLVSTVTGVAPFVSYVRTLHRDWKQGKFPEGHKLYLLNGASRSWEFGYYDEVSKVAAEVPWLTYVATVSRPWEDNGWQGEHGRVDDLIRKYTDLWGLSAETTTAYLCGHPHMIENSKGILQRVGFTKENLKEEIYWIPAKAAKTS